MGNASGVGSFIQQLLELVYGVGKEVELIPIGLSEGGAWLVPTATLMPRASTKAVSSCCCCWRRVSAMSRGRELKLAVRCSSLDSRLPICFSRSSLRSLSSVIKSYMTFCIWGVTEWKTGRRPSPQGNLPWGDEMPSTLQQEPPPPSCIPCHQRRTPGPSR